MTEPTEAREIDPAMRLQAQKRRNMWLALALIAFVVTVGVSTAVRIQETDFSGTDRLYFSGYLDEAATEKANREAQERAEARKAEIMATEPQAQPAEATEASDE
ncbi:MAG: hypothetical protein AAFO74_06940 [Pseudomonadota bacterium]